MKIGDKIRNAREDKDISQKKISELIPMNQSNYSKIERNMQEPNIEQLRRICEILSIDPRYLLGIDEDKPISPEDRRLLADIKKFIEEHKN